jgi:4-amino-4-deoxy-L-arabinose transferase-like glycosyltransferase
MQKKEIFAILMLILFVVLCVTSFQKKTVAGDEPTYLQSAGYMYFKGDFKTNLEHPPLLKMIIGLPLIFLNQDQNILPYCRLIVTLLGTILGITIYLFTKKIYGINAALFALFLYTLSPNILAHSRLATLDIGTTLFFFLAITSFILFLEKQNIKWLFITGIVFGLALGTKFTTILLGPIFIIIIITFYFYKKNFEIKYINKYIPPNYTKNTTFHLIIGFISIMFIGIIVLHLLYLPQGELNQDGQTVFNQMSENNIVKIQKLFLPDNYVFGLGLQGLHSEFGQDAYLFGMRSETGWWYYYILALIIKIPIAMLLFFILSITFICLKKIKNKLKHKDTFNEWILIIPVVIFFGYFSFLNNVNIGIRYIMPIYPFIFIYVSKLVNLKINYWKYILILLFLWYALSSFFIYPHYLNYFNEFVGPENGYKYLLDSNVDWNQNGQYVQEYGNKIFEETGTRMITNPNCEPTQGIIAISVNRVHGLSQEDTDCYSWLREGYEPIDMIVYTHFIYDTRE